MRRAAATASGPMGGVKAARGGAVAPSPQAASPASPAAQTARVPGSAPLKA